ncbi:hypothetical protein N7470_009974 [Penicillium chermesinum]|nr:hypothetical protein N7470_009974 [Penicillium chermesinum]
MQEHIRRAHPNHYIPKLPATEESFLLMVNTPPEQRAHLSPPDPVPRRRGQSDSFGLNVRIANGYLQMRRIETSMSPMPAPRPPLELWMNPTPPRPRLLSHSLNYTTID